MVTSVSPTIDSSSSAVVKWEIGVVYPGDGWKDTLVCYNSAPERDAFFFGEGGPSEDEVRWR